VPWKPRDEHDFPTLGWYVLDWIPENLAAPDVPDYEPFRPYPEQEDFILEFYRLDPVTGRRKIRRGVISRPRGWGKSPLLAALANVEALADVVPDGWDANGQPVGRPWRDIRTPLVQIAAVSDDQTKNTWTPLLEMLEGPVLDNYPGLEPLDTFVNLPRRGKIEHITSSARTVKGNRPNFVVLDQTEEWIESNGGKKLAKTIRINAAKTGGSTVESPNAFIPGEDSVAEDSAAYWDKIVEGKARDDGLTTTTAKPRPTPTWPSATRSRPACDTPTAMPPATPTAASSTTRHARRDTRTSTA
jgi:phage terminase large subunit-like protein